MNIAKKLFSFLNESGISYVVVGDVSEYPQKIKSDIDIVIQPKDLPLVGDFLLTFTRKYQGLNLVQCLQHEQTAWYFVLARFDENGIPEFLHPDICGDYFRNGALLLRAVDLLEGRIEAIDSTGAGKGFFVSSSKMEFIYYLLKKIDKGKLYHHHKIHITSEWHKDPEGCREQLHKHWEGAAAKTLMTAVDSNEWGNIENKLSNFRQSLHESFSFSLQYWWRETRRKAFRFLYPTGLLIVVLGADGSGKSSVINEVSTKLSPAFRKTQYIHLRPRVGKRSAEKSVPVENPHGQQARGLLTSVAKILYFFFDYCVGYLVKIRPMLVHSTLVIFDRYYYDLLVDTKRYRYGGPLWFAKLVGYFIPKPDVCLLLDAPADVIQDRKQEVSKEETERQRQEYLKLINKMDNGVVIDASQPLDSVVEDVNRHIIQILTKRNQERLKKLFGAKERKL